MRDWYRPAPAPALPTATPLTWSDLLEQWTIITLDFHEVFGVDMASGILRDRTWRWFEDHLRDLLVRGPRLSLWLSRRSSVV